MLDLKTIMVSYFTGNVLVAVLMAILWRQNRMRYGGLSLWLFASILQALGALLCIPRGILPDIVTIVFAGALSVGGHLAWYSGLERFVGKQRTQIHNVLILTIYIFLVSYFAYVREDISMRIIVLSAACLLITAQCSDLMLRRTDPRLKPVTRYVGFVFLLYTLAALARLTLYALNDIPPDTALFQLPKEDKAILLVWQMLNLGLMFALGMMVTGRQRLDIERQDAESRLAEEALRESEGKFRAIVSLFPASIAILKSDGQGERFLYVNDAWATLTGYPREDAKLLNPNDMTHPDMRSRVSERAAMRMHGEEVPSRYESKIITRCGEVRWLDFAASVIRYEGAPAILTIGLDITERKRAEKALHESESKYRTLVENIPQKIFTKDTNLVYVSCNENFASDKGIGPDQLAGKTDYDFFPKEMADKYRSDDKRIMATGKTEEMEEKYNRSGKDIWVHTIKTPIRDADGTVTGILGAFRDITKRKKAEEAQEKLQVQLSQAMKLEAVGRLAGGMAHDFNNMLSVILGNTDLILDELDPTQPLCSDLKEIREAAMRSANLTRQLLAFARKQPITPGVLDLNETVKDMLKMLQRLIGEDIDLVWQPEESLWPVKVDPSQIDQIMANLCVNARDAIAGVGKITIETHNVTVDETYLADYPEFVPGEYVQLIVSDNGCGMDKDIQAHLFEPFFTTKGAGEGTGLGLATIYGIVNQNKGIVLFDSDPGHGSSFKIYLPRHQAEMKRVQKESMALSLAPGHETILLVEDEDAILNMVTRVLEKYGYHVLAASTPGKAVHAAKNHAGEINLLITDVVMPEMNGRDLAKQLTALFPGLRCLFMSGYVNNIIARYGVMDEGVDFIQKPFSTQALAAKVREILDN